jgi:hypothetical protein
VIGNDNFDELLATTRVAGSEQQVNIDWPGYWEAMRQAGVDPASVVTLSWAHFSERNVEALIESTTLVALHPDGIFSTAGKRKLFGGSVKYRTIDFAMVKSYGPDDYLDEHHGIFKFFIEFAGAGGIFLGRLEWYARGRRFRDRENRITAMDAAGERDRFFAAVEKILG